MRRTTRVWEYPWAAHAIELRPGMQVIDVGGSFSGFAMTLASVGVDVTIIDPDPGEHCPEVLVEASSRQRGGQVTFVRATADDTQLMSASADAAFCISVVEHIERAGDREALMQGVHDLLKPGGSFVMTVDLVLDLAPFTEVHRRGDLQNVDLSELIDSERFELVSGTTDELCGMPGFDPTSIVRRAARGEFLVASGNIMSQCFVLSTR